MSYFSDYAENKLVDMFRAQAWALPGSLYLGLASAAADGAITELAGTSYARVAVARSLANWAGTQGAGTTLASVGTSHATSNNIVVDWGTSGSIWGTATHVVFYDASTVGNAICYVPLITPQVIGNGVPVSLGIGLINMTLGLAGGCSDYLANKLIDFVFRGQAFSYPGTGYLALYTVLPNNAGGGTEVGGSIGYARVSTAFSLVNWSGTQGATTTTVSTGTSGESSNNNIHTFGAPTALWGAVVGVGILDSIAGGNLLFWGPLSAPKTVVAGASPPVFPVSSVKIRFA